MSVGAARRAGWFVLLIAACTVFPPVVADAGPIGKIVARGAGRAVTRRAAPWMARAMARDLTNHRAASVRKLVAPRTVFRYTSRSAARTELKRGIAPFHHMTSRGGAGRPLGAVAAARRYALPALPQVRETIRLPGGQRVILNKVPGGAAGRRELVSRDRVWPPGISHIVRLKK